MNMQNYTTPFANTGDREEFSINTDPSGKVSLEKGWTELYQLRPEEGGLFILRRVFNQMMKLVSTDTVTWKTQTFPNWIDDKGDGLPFAYPKNAIVKYTNGNTYVSLVNNNTQIPTGANWKLFDTASTPLDDTVKLSGNQTIAGVKTFSSSPIVPTPTSNTQAANKTYVDSKIASGSGIGVGQSWQDVTASRSEGVTYTNTTGRPIEISVNSTNSSSADCRITVDGVLRLASITPDNAVYTSAGSIIIPSGSTYSATFGAGGLGAWHELR